MSTERETVLNVTGMSCASCVRHVDQALRALRGVTHVDVRLGDGEVRVHHDAESAPPEALVTALEEAGYPRAGVCYLSARAMACCVCWLRA